MGIAELLTVALVVLKLLGRINCSWFVAVLPEIIAIVFYVAITIMACKSHRW